MDRFSFVKASNDSYMLVCNDCYQRNGLSNLVAVLSGWERALSDFIEFAEKHNKLANHD